MKFIIFKNKTYNLNTFKSCEVQGEMIRFVFEHNTMEFYSGKTHKIINLFNEFLRGLISYPMYQNEENSVFDFEYTLICLQQEEEEQRRGKK